MTNQIFLNLKGEIVVKNLIMKKDGSEFMIDQVQKVLQKGNSLVETLNKLISK